MSAIKYIVDRFGEIDAAAPVSWIRLYSKLREAARQQEQTLQLSCEQALCAASLMGNRYRDVLPYDHSRVRLMRPAGGDYVNASALHVPRAHRKFILTQGPLQHTCGDFWRMVWEQDSHCIVMLNRLIENNCQKCAPYYPSSVEKPEMRFGELVVRVESVDAREHYTVRTLSLHAESGDGAPAPAVPPPEGNGRCEPNGEVDSGGECADAGDTANGPAEPEAKRCQTDGDCDEEHDGSTRESSVVERRTVKHFHYTNWPDFGVPDNTDVFLSFLLEIRKSGLLDVDRYGPAVVHCSAGIGRSGTFVVVDSVLVMLHKTPDMDASKVDLLNLVLDLRKSRMGLIQTPEQLYFSWLAIKDALSDDKWCELLSTTCSPSASVGESPVRRRGIDRTGGNMLPDDMRHISFDERDLVKRKKHSFAMLDAHTEVESRSAAVLRTGESERSATDDECDNEPVRRPCDVSRRRCTSATTASSGGGDTDSPLDQQIRARLDADDDDAPAGSRYEQSASAGGGVVPPSTLRCPRIGGEHGAVAPSVGPSPPDRLDAPPPPPVRPT